MGSTGSLPVSDEITMIEDEIEALNKAVREAPAEQPTRLTLGSKIQKKILGFLIRPTRCVYKMSNLGEKRFRIKGDMFVREDLTLRNGRGIKLECSHWKNVTKSGKQPCVVFLHGNAGSRMDALPYVQDILSRGASLFAFDFAGCGLSEGTYVSLGFFERDDARVVTKYLKCTEICSSVVLWGHSMGAATAQMFATMDPFVKCAVIDSSFRDLVELCKYHSKKKIFYGEKMFRSTLKQKMFAQVKKLTGANLKKCKPSLYLKHQQIPTVYVYGRRDDIVPNDHVLYLHANNPTKYKDIIEFNGTHNQRRPKIVVDRVIMFLCKHGGLEEQTSSTSDGNDDDSDAQIPIWKDPTLGNSICAGLFGFLKKSSTTATTTSYSTAKSSFKMKRSRAGKALYRTALKLQSKSKHEPKHRLTLSGVKGIKFDTEDDGDKE